MTPKKLSVIEKVVVVISVLIQLPLAVFLGHHYDERLFIDTGYLVSSGLNPYLQYNITVFSNPELMGTNPIIGYPPLWPLLLGVTYYFTYNLVPDLFLYNFAIKIPLIAANIGLAFLTRRVMKRFSLPNNAMRFAWLFLLFNPFTLLTTVAWGAFDTLIAVLCLASLYFLSKDMVKECVLLLSLSIVLKPIAFPLLGLPLLCSSLRNRNAKAVYLSVLFLMVAIFWVLPFSILGWTAPTLPSQVTSYFRMAGGLTVFNIFEVTQNTAILPADLAFMGYLWIPAILFVYYLLYRNPPKTAQQLFGSAFVLLFTGFLSRTWLSEPNINLLLPLALIMMGFGAISKRTFHLLWFIPFVFLFLNYAFPQLFFLVYPPIISAIGTFDLQIGASRLLARFALTVVWYAVALRVLYLLLRKQ